MASRNLERVIVAFRAVDVEEEGVEAAVVASVRGITCCASQKEHSCGEYDCQCHCEVKGFGGLVE